MNLRCSYRVRAAFAITILLFASGCDHQSTDELEADQDSPAPTVDYMRHALEQEERWVKVHAAEFLTSLDYRAGVRDQITDQLRQYEDEPEYRIGLWRAMAQLDRHDELAFSGWVQRILSVFLDTASPDRIHAGESLAKLNYRFGDGDASRTVFQEFAERGPIGGRAYAWWVLLQNNAPQAENELTTLLSHDQPLARQTAAYVLRHQPAISQATDAALTVALSNEPEDSPARPYLLTSVYRHSTTKSPNLERHRAELLELLARGEPGGQYEVSRLAAEVGDAWQSELLALLERDDVSADVKSSVAHALCRVERRQSSNMSMLDWMVVVVYAIGMLVVGIYYARRTSTADEYLLGGRNMRSWMVGLSLFATLLSTLSYLAWPGEMIKHGPMILLGYTAYPFVFLVVGWFLIPRLMQQRVTSAYEILEIRFGYSIRMLASLLFLSLRFLWMASIIYWTTSIVLIPASGLDERYTSVIAIALGLVTVIYTSLGGLRAVVLTDVIQTFVLFSGAIISLVLITSSLGGIAAWFPTEWADHWTAPRIWFDFDPSTRATLANAMLGTFCWYVCTAGADQMAIQRYLATQDVKAARKSLAISLLSDFTVVFFLGLMGLALLAFFSANPDRMADGQTIYANADKLFPRFVIVGLPIGISGLVIAGLLAAAMSSLSSGVNSSAAVICEDLVRRSGRHDGGQQAHMRLARRISVVVGVAVVLLSSVIGLVQGNMLEVVYKVVNLFTAPLFYLFFMAIFTTKANTVGTWVGSIVGIATAVLIAFWKEFTGEQGISFLWIIPSSLTVSVAVGMVASFLFNAKLDSTTRENRKTP